MSTTICLVAMIPDTLISVTEIRAMRVAPGAFAPSIIGRATQNGKNAEVGFPLQIIESKTREDRQKLKEQIIASINQTFEQFEATQAVAEAAK